MKNFAFAVSLFLLITSVSALSGSASHHSYVFHCEGDKLMCGGNLSEPFKPKMVNLSTLRINHSINRDEGKIRDLLSLKMENETKFKEKLEREKRYRPYSGVEEGDYEIKVPQKEELRRFEELEFGDGYRTDYSILNGTALVSKAIFRTTWEGVPITIEYTSNNSHGPDYRPFSSSFHFYPRNSFTKEEIDVNSGCHRTKVNRTGSFYMVDWYKTFDPWYCIRGFTLVTGGPTPVVNITPYLSKLIETVVI